MAELTPDAVLALCVRAVALHADDTAFRLAVANLWMPADAAVCAQCNKLAMCQYAFRRGHDSDICDSLCDECSTDTLVVHVRGGGSMSITYTPSTVWRDVFAKLNAHPGWERIDVISWRQAWGTSMRTETKKRDTHDCSHSVRGSCLNLLDADVKITAAVAGEREEDGEPSVLAGSAAKRACL